MFNLQLAKCYGCKQTKVVNMAEPIGEITGRLFALVENKEIDAETRIWAREELSKLIKLVTTPIFIPSDPGFREYKP